MFSKFTIFILVSLSCVGAILGGSPSASPTCDYYIARYEAETKELIADIAAYVDEGISTITDLHEANPDQFQQEFGIPVSNTTNVLVTLMLERVQGFFTVIADFLPGETDDSVKDYFLNGGEAEFPLNCLRDLIDLMALFDRESQRLIEFADNTVRKHVVKVIPEPVEIP